jgi:predicted RNA-binding protein associated with RNAse of E/G family
MFPVGSVTFGCFWAGRNYNLYRFTGPDGHVIAYRFDVVRSVHLTPGHITYTDLLLDAWLPPGGELRIEDEDEVRAADTAGLLTSRDIAIINRTGRLLERNYRRIVAEAEAELATRAQALDGKRESRSIDDVPFHR